MREYALRHPECLLRYHDLPGEDAPILFLHGLGCAGSFDYPEVAGQPELSRHRRILVDLVGSGFSDKPDDFGYSVGDHAACLNDFVRGLKLDRVILYGHSLGGAVALALAARLGPLLERVILSEANLDAGGGTFSRGIAAQEYSEFEARGFEALVRAHRRPSGALWATSLSMCSPRAIHSLSRSAVEGERPSWREILYALACPKTFIFGERSLPDENRAALERRGVHIEIVPGAGHSMAWENPKGLAIAIRNGIRL